MKYCHKIHIILVCFIVFWGCSKADKSVKLEDQVLKTLELTHTNCKQLKSASPEEYIEYQTTEDNFLSIKHVNASLNCCPDSILVVSGIKDGKLNYTVCHKAIYCNCNCYYDLNCKIGPLEYGKYTFRISVCTGAKAEFILNFTGNTNGKYYLKK